MASDDDKNFADALPTGLLCAAGIIMLLVGVGSLLAACDNGASQRQQADRIEKQIERDRGR